MTVSVAVAGDSVRFRIDPGPAPDPVPDDAVAVKRTVPAAPAFWAPPPHGVVAQRRLFTKVMMGEENGIDRAEQASGGLLPCFSDVPGMRFPWIAKHALCTGALD
jgi:hypothetical protein